LYGGIVRCLDYSTVETNFGTLIPTLAAQQCVRDGKDDEQ
jgi:hypothetical protein